MIRPLFACAGLVLVAVAASRVCAAEVAARLFPAAGAVNVPPDVPLRLSFDAPPKLGAAGKIQVFDAVTDALVDAVDVSAPVGTKSIGGLSDYKYYPVLVVGNDALVTLKSGALAYGKSYYVTAAPGIVQCGADGSAGIEGPKAWKFSTQAAAPAAGAAKLSVAADGTGDFCTVQGALDFIPDGNTTPTTIFVRKGTYTEIVFFFNKHALTLLGEDRTGTVIGYPNNAAFNGAGGNPFAGNSPDPSASDPKTGGAIYRRGAFTVQHANDLTIANLTLRNTTPQGGSQAEAIIVNGTTTAHAIFKDVDFYSFQDTVQINGQAYLSNCHFEGDVDFMWGTGPSFFEHCTARSLRSGAFYTQIRNPGTNHGFVYVRCTFDGAPGIAGNFLSRVPVARFPHSEVVLIDCVLTGAVGPVAWQLQGVPAAASAGTTAPPATNDIHFWEFNSHGPDGKPVDVSQRFAVSRQLTPPGDAALIADYGNPVFVLGEKWDPKSAAIFRAGGKR